MARVLAPGGRVAIGDAVTDKPVMRVFDRALRLFQRSHVGLKRSAEIERLLGGAGLGEPQVRTLWDGYWAIVAARKPAAAA